MKGEEVEWQCERGGGGERRQEVCSLRAFLAFYSRAAPRVQLKDRLDD
jgi:hypothetical protein